MNDQLLDIDLNLVFCHSKTGGRSGILLFLEFICNTVVAKVILTKAFFNIAPLGKI